MEDVPEKARVGNVVNLETLKQLQMVKGIIICLGGLHSIPVEGCSPSQWRKTLLGYGTQPRKRKGDLRAPQKIDFKMAVRRHFERCGYDIGTNDESDALGILNHFLHGQDAVARSQGDLLSMIGGKL